MEPQRQLTSPTAHHDLAALVAPLAADEFVRSYFAQRVLHQGGREVDYYADLFRGADLDRLVHQASEHVRTNLKPVRAGKDSRLLSNDPMLPQLRNAYSDGWTVVIDRVELPWLPLARLARQVEL